MAVSRRPSKSDALLQALLSGENIARPKPYRSPFAGARPAIAKAAPGPTVSALPVEPVDTSGFAGIGTLGLGTQQKAGPNPLGQAIWSAVKLFGNAAAKSHGGDVPPAFSYKPKRKVT
jgi:hypothetical protein